MEKGKITKEELKKIIREHLPFPFDASSTIYIEKFNTDLERWKANLKSQCITGSLFEVDLYIFGSETTDTGTHLLVEVKDNGDIYYGRLFGTLYAKNVPWKKMNI